MRQRMVKYNVPLSVIILTADDATFIEMSTIMIIRNNNYLIWKTACPIVR